jgi:ribosomal protein S4
MSRLDEARQRLQAAVVRLERAVELSRRQSSERAELARSLEEARAEGKALREVSATLSSRLDSVIGRLKSVIEVN